MQAYRNPPSTFSFYAKNICRFPPHTGQNVQPHCVVFAAVDPFFKSKGHPGEPSRYHIPVFPSISIRP